MVFDAIPRSVLQLIRGSTVPLTNPLSNALFHGEIDIKNKCLIHLLEASCWLQLYAQQNQRAEYGDVDWRKSWLLGDKFCMNNTIKEASFKIMHEIYPTKKTLQRFNIDIYYSCAFCGLE